MADFSDTNSELNHWSGFLFVCFYLISSHFIESSTKCGSLARAKLCSTSWWVFEITSNFKNRVKLRCHSSSWRKNTLEIQPIGLKAYNFGEPIWIWYSWNDCSLRWNAFMLCLQCKYLKKIKHSMFPTPFAEEAQTQKGHRSMWIKENTFIQIFHITCMLLSPEC